MSLSRTGVRRPSLAAGKSRADRFGGNRARNRETTVRSTKLDRRASEGLPFEADVDADADADEPEYEEEPEEEEAPRTPRTPAAAPASASSRRHSSAAASASARPSQSARSTRSPAASHTPARSAAASSPRSAQSQSQSADRRKNTKRETNLRASSGFSPVFPRSRATSLAPSGRPSLAPSDDGDAADESMAEDQFAFDAAGGDEDQMDYAAPEEEEAPAASYTSPAKKKAQGVKRKAPPKGEVGGPTSLGGGRVGRKTMHMINTARELGMIDEEGDNVGSGDEGTARKRQRPTRNRLAPIAYWELKEFNYTRTSDGIGAVLPVLDPEQPVVQLVKSPASKPKIHRPRSKQPKHHSNSSSSSHGPALGDHSADEGKRDPIPSFMTIISSEGNEVQVQALAKNSNQIPLEALGISTGRAAPLPHGGKAFEQPEFSSGILSLPPRAKKQREIANNNEIFYVISGPTNSLQLKLHTQQMNLCAGAQFMIPAGNTYELTNSSTNETIKLLFVLVKPAATWMAEFQLQAEQAAEEEAAVADEEEEEEEEEVHYSRKSGKPKRK